MAGLTSLPEAATLFISLWVFGIHARSFKWKSNLFPPLPFPGGHSALHTKPCRTDTGTWWRPGREKNAMPLYKQQCTHFISQKLGFRKISQCLSAICLQVKASKWLDVAEMRLRKAWTGLVDWGWAGHIYSICKTCYGETRHVALPSESRDSA